MQYLSENLIDTLEIGNYQDEKRLCVDKCNGFCKQAKLNCVKIIDQKLQRYKMSRNKCEVMTNNCNR